MVSGGNAELLLSGVQSCKMNKFQSLPMTTRTVTTIVLHPPTAVERLDCVLSVFS